MYKKDFYEAIEAAGHVLRRDELGEIDIFVLETHTHNGPGCVNCEAMWCHHCQQLPILPCENRQPLSLASAKYSILKQDLLSRSTDWDQDTVKLNPSPPDPVDDADGA